MANFLVELLSGRRLSSQSRQFLQSSQASKAHNHLDTTQPADTSGSDADSTSSSVAVSIPHEDRDGLLVLDPYPPRTKDATSSSSFSRSSSLLKIKSAEESLRCSYQSSSSLSSSKRKNKVALSTVTIHYHGQVLGEHAHVATAPGLPIALGWKRLDSETFASVDQYEQRTRRQPQAAPQGKACRRLRLSQRTREQLLRRQGVTASEIQAFQHKQHEEAEASHRRCSAPVSSPSRCNWFDFQACTILARAGEVAETLEETLDDNNNDQDHNNQDHNHGKIGLRSTLFRIKNTKVTVFPPPLRFHAT